jgi:hypothetical protein
MNDVKKSDPRWSLVAQQAVQTGRQRGRSERNAETFYSTRPPQAAETAFPQGATSQALSKERTKPG